MTTLARSWTAGRRLSAAAERRAFARLRLPDGIFKTTASHRLTDVDLATTALLPARGTPLAIMDAGASSGVTSLELFEAIEAAGHEATMTVTDLSLSARHLRIAPGFGALVDTRGRVLQHLVAGLPVRTWRRRLDYVTQFWVAVWLANRWHARLAASGAVARAQADGEPVLLVAPEVAAHPAIRCQEADVLAPPPANEVGRFDVVRAANLLLPEVFTNERLATAIANLRARLRGPGALLILARSPPPGTPGDNRATIYRVAPDGGLSVAARLGGGSELEKLVGTNSSSAP